MGVADVLIKIMNEQNIRKADIARLAGLPYSTIAGIFKRGDEKLKLPTLQKLAKGLGITLDELMGLPPAVPNIVLTDSEKNLIVRYRMLTNEDKGTVSRQIDALLALSDSESKKIDSAGESFKEA